MIVRTHFGGAQGRIAQPHDPSAQRVAARKDVERDPLAYQPGAIGVGNLCPGHRKLHCGKNRHHQRELPHCRLHARLSTAMVDHDLPSRNRASTGNDTGRPSG
jgi:hypothetical protein